VNEQLGVTIPEASLSRTIRSRAGPSPDGLPSIGRIGGERPRGHTGVLSSRRSNVRVLRVLCVFLCRKACGLWRACAGLFIRLQAGLAVLVMTYRHGIIAYDVLLTRQAFDADAW